MCSCHMSGHWPAHMMPFLMPECCMHLHYALRLLQGAMLSMRFGLQAYRGSGHAEEQSSHSWLVVMAPKCFACPEGDRLQWTDRLDTLCLGRCSCTNQVSSVSLSVLCCRRMDISPVTPKKRKTMPSCSLKVHGATGQPTIVATLRHHAAALC